MRGSGLIEALVALFVFALVAGAFLGAMTGFLRGTARASQLQGAVSCAGHVVESVRAGLLTPGAQPQDGSCAAAGWPTLGYRLESVAGGGPAGGGAGSPAGTWPALSVTVFPAGRQGQPAAALYRVVTAASLATSGP
ncbi:prepilin-type cleavage/methylation domain-containing protein [Thermaerobacter sp. PB12/4term]|uniref:type IV pilus modification PilV family protein n=1 Tax=Thermaerobacter sp. PB12/4term TaxID=2293838 RepID=UPI001FACFF16|nr:prepilin-type cleavage/methylation domain-containing protein [Thermaerobacter sp. PB12/4term]